MPTRGARAWRSASAHNRISDVDSASDQGIAPGEFAGGPGIAVAVGKPL